MKSYRQSWTSANLIIVKVKHEPIYALSQSDIIYNKTTTALLFVDLEFPEERTTWPENE